MFHVEYLETLGTYSGGHNRESAAHSVQHFHFYPRAESQWGDKQARSFEVRLQIIYKAQ